MENIHKLWIMYFEKLLALINFNRAVVDLAELVNPP